MVKVHSRTLNRGGIIVVLKSFIALIKSLMNDVSDGVENGEKSVFARIIDRNLNNSLRSRPFPRDCLFSSYIYVQTNEVRLCFVESDRVRYLESYISPQSLGYSISYTGIV